MNREIDFVSLLKAGVTETAPPPGLRTHLQFSVRRRVIMHTRFKRAFDEIGRLHYRGVHAKVAEGLLLVAQSGSGKSTLLQHYETQFPRFVLNGVWQIPVLSVITPEAPTVKSLAEAILVELGDPYASRGNAREKTDRIVHLCGRCGVELLMLDEFQHFADRSTSREAERVTDWLKLLLKRLSIPVVLVGLPRAVQVVNSNRQLRRLFSAPHYMEPFSFETQQGRLEFRGVLKALGDPLPPGSIEIHAPNNAERFYYACNGLIDYVVKILDDAVSRGGSGAGGAVTLSDCERSFKQTIWSFAPDRLNPFNERAKLRLLTRPGEPFDNWDDPSLYINCREPTRMRKLVQKLVC